MKSEYSLNMEDLAPVVLFVYNRLDHTRQTIEALQKNDLASHSILYVFADGIKVNQSPEQVRSVHDVRDYIHSITGFKQIIIEESKINMGLAQSIVKGVTKIVNQYGKVIVLEDDIVTSPFFLTYMNEALLLYENDIQVMHVAGYMYPLKKNGLPDTFFYPAASCWGWATWSRSWKYYNSNAEQLYSRLKNEKLIDTFNINTIHDFEHQLVANINGSLNTWFVKWHASVVLNHGYCLYPRLSLVQNVGFDNTGVHCGYAPQFYCRKLANCIVVIKQPFVYNQEAIRLLKEFKLTPKSSFCKKVKNCLSYRLGKVISFIYSRVCRC